MVFSIAASFTSSGWLPGSCEYQSAFAGCPENTAQAPGRQHDPSLATLADIDDLLKIEAEVFACNRIARRSFARFISSPGALLLVERQQLRCVGYVLVLFHPAGRVARIYSLAVAPDARGTGVGTSLLNTAERAAAIRQATLLRLEVSSRNLSAQRLYWQRGFEVFGRHDGYYSDGADAIRLQKQLLPYASIDAK